jgi:hypothetical protein
VRIADGQVASHVRYDEKAFGDWFMASIFPLHSGRYFGIVGVIVFMVASLAMPLFAITGWMLYLARRQQKKRVRMQVPGETDLGVGATRPDIALEVDCWRRPERPGRTGSPAPRLVPLRLEKLDPVADRHRRGGLQVREASDVGRGDQLGLDSHQPSQLARTQLRGEPSLKDRIAAG